MLKPVSGTAKDKEPSRRHRRCRRLKMISTLPTLLTLSSVCFGFAALYCCALELHDLGAGQDAARVITLEREFLEYKASTYLAIAAWIVLAGMICDALDGRVARMTNSVSRFGEQLDSLTDLLTFGVAPALMVVTLVRRELAADDLAHGDRLRVLHGASSCPVPGRSECGRSGAYRLPRLTIACGGRRDREPGLFPRSIQDAP